MHCAFIFIAGNHMADIASVLEKSGYKIAHKESKVNLNKAQDFIDDGSGGNHVAHKISYFAHGWTCIVDPEIEIAVDPDILSPLSRSLHAKILAYFDETTSGCYGFGVYEKGKQTRSVFWDGNMLTQSGSPLAQERKLQWDGDGDDVAFDVVLNLGPKVRPFEHEASFDTYNLRWVKGQ